MAIISEYEQTFALNKDDIPQDQPDNERELVKKVNELLARSKRHRKRYDADWHYNYEFVCSGKQWPIDRPRWRFSEVVNITWASIMTEIAIQTDSKPKFEFTSQEWGDEAFVDALKEINSRNWDKYNWSTVISDALFDCKLYHVAHAEVSWDPELEDGLGDVSFSVLDPFYSYWDPRASDVNKGKRARWFIYAEPVPTSELKLKYKDKEDQIKSDVSLLNARTDFSSGMPGRVYTNFDPYSPSRLPSSATATGELYGGEPHTVLIRCWLRDDALEELCEEKEVGPDSPDEEAKEYLLVKKYPNGRYIEMCNNVILRDTVPGVEIKGEWVPYMDECFPIAKLVNYSYPREYAGENEVTHTKGPQKITNFLWSYILDNFKMQGNPRVILGSAADIDEEDIVNEPGTILNAADINQIRFEPGTPATPGSMDLFNQSLGILDKVQGLQDVTRGATDANIGSAIMMEGYAEAAQTRPRMKNRNLDAFLQATGQLVLKRMMQFYTQPRVFRLTNKEGYPEFMEFYMPTDENGQKVAKITRISTGAQGQMIPGAQKTVEVKGVPDVRVTSGSALPYAKALKANTALTALNAGAIDREEYLKSVDWPNYQEVLKRMGEQEQAMAQAQAQAKAK